MISSHRTRKAYQEGRDSAIKTRCSPERTECRYYLHSAQHKAYMKGWNSIFKPFRRILSPAHKASKVV